MTQIRAAIAGIHGYVPKDLLTNADLEQMVDTSDEWITSRTGIKQRHILKEPNTAVSDMGVRAARPLLEKTGTSVDEIDLVICATSTPDLVFPSTACLTADKLGIKNAFCFDVMAACSGLIYTLTTASKFIESGSHKCVLVISGDKMSSIIDYTDRKTCVIFGDGCGALLLKPTTDGTGILDAELQSDGSGAQYLHMKAGGSLKPASHETVDAREHFVFQDGGPVFKRAVQGMSGTLRTVMQRNDLAADDVAWVVPHQANERIIRSVASMADFPMERVMMNIERYGNTTNGTIPLCLAEWEKHLKSGDNILLTAFGGGFTWGSVYLKWHYDGAAASNGQTPISVF